MPRRIACNSVAISPTRTVFLDCRVIALTWSRMEVSCHTAKPVSAAQNASKMPKPPYNRPRMRKLKNDMKRSLHLAVSLEGIENDEKTSQPVQNAPHRERACRTLRQTNTVA